MSTRRPIADYLAADLGLGLLPRRVTGRDEGAGTLGALVALPITLLSPGWKVAAVVGLVLLGLWVTRDLGDDPGWVVIDETAGAAFAMLGSTGWGLAAAWIVARVADIAKDWFPGVRQAERLPGGWGVMADDLVAGVYGLAAGWLVRWLTG